MSEIVVKSQKEWDEIPKDFQGYVYIESPRSPRLVIAERKGIVVLRGNSSVEAWGNSSVVAWGNSSVVAWGNSSVEAWGNSSVVAWENSSVEARGNSSVEARGNSSVVAWENSSVVARGNVQIAQYSEDTNLKIQGNARIVKPPRTAEEYCDFFGIEARDGQAVVYKAVRENLASFWDSRFQYKIGGKVEHDCDPSTDVECGQGMHVSHLARALDFGMCKGNSFKIIECLVPLDKMVVYKWTDGKVRTSELTVLRELPMEEWGIYGKIVAKKLAGAQK